MSDDRRLTSETMMSEKSLNQPEIIILGIMLYFPVLLISIVWGLGSGSATKVKILLRSCLDVFALFPERWFLDVLIYSVMYYFVP